MTTPTDSCTQSDWTVLQAAAAQGLQDLLWLSFLLLFFQPQLPCSPVSYQVSVCLCLPLLSEVVNKAHPKFSPPASPSPELQACHAPSCDAHIPSSSVTTNVLLPASSFAKLSDLGEDGWTFFSCASSQLSTAHTAAHKDLPRELIPCRALLKA